MIAGGVAAIVNYSSRFLFSHWFTFAQAIVLAYIAGMITAFVLMRGHVFSARNKPLAPQIWKFIGVNVLAVIQTLIISVYLARWVFPTIGIVGHAEALAHLIGVLVPVATSYLGHRLLTFR